MGRTGRLRIASRTGAISLLRQIQPKGQILHCGGPPSGPADERMRELAIPLALHRSPNRKMRQAKASKVCTTVTNTLVQIAVSTLSARADGAAQGRGSREVVIRTRGAVVQDAEGSKQQRPAGACEAPSPACKPRAVVRSDFEPPALAHVPAELRRWILTLDFSGCRWPYWSS
jgi:hypothetical protein